VVDVILEFIIKDFLVVRVDLTDVVELIKEEMMHGF